MNKTYKSLKGSSGSRSILEVHEAKSLGSSSLSVDVDAYRGNSTKLTEQVGQVLSGGIPGEISDKKVGARDNISRGLSAESTNARTDGGLGNNTSGERQHVQGLRSADAKKTPAIRA